MTDFTRQRAWFDADNLDAAATIVGCGGIGSFTAVALAKLGFKRLHLIDFDTIEEHNLPNQFFLPEHLETPKVDSLREMVRWMTPDCEVTYAMDPFSAENLTLNPVVISALDSVSARAELWKLVRMKLPVRTFIDGRLAGQRIVVYAVKPTNMTDIDGYEATLHSDDEAIEDSCTARSIIDVGFSVASLIARTARLTYTDHDRESIYPMTYYNHETLELNRGQWL